MQLRYDAQADRILWQLRTRTGALFAAWLTRRMLQKLWPPFIGLVTHSEVTTQVAPGAMVLPDARRMLADGARSRPLAGTDFQTPFDAKPVEQPLGAEPLLPVAIDLGPGPEGRGLMLRLRDANQRSVEIKLNDELSAALLRLLEKALAAADWGIVTTPASADAVAPSAPRLLN